MGTNAVSTGVLIPLQKQNQLRRRHILQDMTLFNMLTHKAPQALNGRSRLRRKRALGFPSTQHDNHIVQTPRGGEPIRRGLFAEQQVNYFKAHTNVVGGKCRQVLRQASCQTPHNR
ncbi:hypothetical protein H257_10485 [Aphanomyces astaci]|uniref:Uncharacterized protein n=1 Tax=Aphanomyces astaci TaxID=112090 RepID=W4G6G7_APHAT|nr:hypothetical protein H257_10485 [Aphanomyces astaci]ETV75302.1 hypothetical protein H257_10485 [Aphanomyces astaci]|eukprot:XP_009835350.1 hypothetical protein H257_10485 [Aphanomyces astaci]